MSIPPWRPARAGRSLALFSEIEGTLRQARGGRNPLRPAGESRRPNIRSGKRPETELRPVPLYGRRLPHLGVYLLAVRLLFADLALTGPGAMQLGGGELVVPVDDLALLGPIRDRLVLLVLPPVQAGPALQGVARESRCPVDAERAVGLDLGSLLRPGVLGVHAVD